MKELYYICDSFSKTCLSFKELIECHDLSGTGSSYCFALTDLSNKFNFVLDNETYTLKINEFNGRLDFDFVVKNTHESNNILYLNVEIMNGMYEPGAISLLKNNKNSNERIWLEMSMHMKKSYISASYIYSGVKNEINLDTIIVEGRYILDYYSFYCELGYSFFGKYGYMGNNINAFEDCLIELGRRDKNINILWEDSDISLVAINNTRPRELCQSSSHDMLAIINEHCNLILQ
ncbi:barstar family protein [Pectobacterium carotovorum]|uniref:barstar family protein n=1 Tax=Pectobacterium carotovorum TaxID=554 RepID=UPI001600114F|nr:barstar family protein [Pectobacterium carotovorum]MBB1527620.1 barstar family protein [Pectobacterium carotovorum subsp. carotovorum]MCA6964191.1 barstar family protein [Pectobacterium carotovorum]MCH4986623.1 barstar family protein [Pectobacterium carotovorum]WDF99055.1 barstar family protein [Pectobacterium carotovorum subsp. carotovorum]GKW38662.1 hypothetical protein PEC301875_26860 [Pectobacterium carotovorum subsp. carotovorum]